MKNLIAKIEKKAKKYFVGASGWHDWTHVDRVKDVELRRHLVGKKFIQKSCDIRRD